MASADSDGARAHAQEKYFNSEMIVCYAVNITYENLAEELVKQGYLEAVTGLQKLDFNYRYGITFKDFNLRDKLVVNGLDIGTQHISFMYHAKKNELIRVLVSKLPMGISDDDICAVLNSYGDILSVQQVTRVIFGQKLDTGDRVVKFKKLQNDIPSYVTVRGWKAYIMYKGQPKTCRFCGKVGHFARDCPSRKPDERPRENRDKSKEKEKADEPTENMEVSEAIVTPTVTPTYEDLVTDLLDNLAEPEPDPVQVPTKVAENLDSDVSSNTPEVKPLGAKESLKGGVTKKGKKRRKKKIPVVEPENSRPYLSEKLEELGLSKYYSGDTFDRKNQRWDCDFCGYSNDNPYMIGIHVRDNHFEELCEFVRKYPDYGRYR